MAGALKANQAKLKHNPKIKQANKSITINPENNIEIQGSANSLGPQTYEPINTLKSDTNSSPAMKYRGFNSGLNSDSYNNSLSSQSEKTLNKNLANNKALEARGFYTNKEEEKHPFSFNANNTPSVDTSSVKTENELTEKNIEKTNINDQNSGNTANSELLTELDNFVKGTDKKNSTIKKSSQPAEVGEKRLQAGLDIFNDTNFLQNVIHDYEAVTYDITWAIAGKKFMAEFFERENAMGSGYSTSPTFFEGDLAKDPNMLLKESQDTVSILSRTGETITTITNLEMENTFGLTRSDRVNTAATIRFNVTQPQSTNLIKQIWLASQELGIERYQQYPFLIQVYLKGRKKDGTLVGDYQPVTLDKQTSQARSSTVGIEIPGTRRLYAIMIRNINFRVEAGGAIYQVEAIRYGDIGMADDHQLVADMKISNIKTFQDFTEGFATEIESQEKHNLGVTKYLLDRYSFSIIGSDDDVSEITKSRIVSDIEKNKDIFFNKDLNNLAVTTEIDYDTSITEILEKHLARTEFMVGKIKGIQEQLADIDKDAVEKWDDIAITKKAFTITSHAIPIGFDTLRQDYQRHFHYVIAVSDWASVQSGIIQEYQAPESRHKQRVSTMMENAIINKKYNYLYTGDNIDVLEFNLEFNYQYVYPYDQLHGVFKRLPEATMVKFQENAQEEANKKEKSNQMKLTFSKAAEDGVIDDLEHLQILSARRFFLENYSSQLTSGAVEPDAGSLSAYNQLVKAYNTDIKKYNLRESDSGVKLKELTPSEVTVRNDWKDEEGSGTGLKWRLAETLNNDNNNLSEDALTKLNVQFYGRSVNNHDGMTDVGSSENAEAQRVLENSFAGGPGIDLMTVTMDIIGDPYWLPRPEIITLNNVLQSLGASTDPKNENMILFQTLYPEEVDPESGFIPPAGQRRDEILTGIYRIYKIEHRFDNGQFTQRLHMQRDVLTDLSFVVNQRNVKKGK